MAKSSIVHRSLWARYQMLIPGSLDHDCTDRSPVLIVSVLYFSVIIHIYNYRPSFFRLTSSGALDPFDMNSKQPLKITLQFV